MTVSVATQRRSWSQITVGPSGADLTGTTGGIIQVAIDALAQRGGGTVRVLPGEYTLEDSLRLRPGITLLGDRDHTILRRYPLVWSDLAIDADIGEKQISPRDPTGFRPGMGVCVWDQPSGWSISDRPQTITDIRDGVLHLRDYLIDDRAAASGGRVVNHFPMILAELADHVVVDGFTLQAAVDDPQGILQGLRAAAVHFWRSPHGVLRNLLVTGNAGDGICLAKTSLAAVVEHCQADHNGYHGIHPGSHSTQCIVRHCDIHDNGSDGLYICWGIRHSQFTDNRIWHNGWRNLRSGISIGHKDTDNFLARNHVYENAKFGVCFRRKTEANAAHRATLRDNVIENNGSQPQELTKIKQVLEPWESIGSGIHVSGMTKDLLLDHNTIRETRQGAAATQRHALVLAQGVSGVRMTDNILTGHPAQAIVDDSGGQNQLQQN